ncbi:hypothetical protein HA520_20635 [Azotobacter chroococcum]|uniref:Uncharacterized protein n=1 Tax=Azotobacter chroococcum TaxID=353 RepID=A0AA44C8N5_9GAMM|nr:hypothetical protein [Azotobacter chroococcum]NHN79654.1 hypothetical protein [Azotobacter chroococcum]
MRIMLFHGEQSIADLADNIYACLSPKTHAVAEAAMLKANPELKEIGSLKPGVILEVPRISGISFKADQSHADPVGQVGEALLQSLEAYHLQFKEAIGEALGVLDKEVTLLKDEELEKLVSQDEVLEELVVAAMQGLEAREKRLKNCESAMLIFERLADELRK